MRFYRLDLTRARGPQTGVPVRALTSAAGEPDAWGAVDVAHLDRDSLIHWLRSSPELAVRFAVILLGHEPMGENE